MVLPSIKMLVAKMLLESKLVMVTLKGQKIMNSGQC